MAAVKTSPPPPSASPGGDSRNRTSLHAMATNGKPAEELPRKPLPLPPLPHGNARLREAPVSPVRVNLQRENWPQPSNADIELAQSQAAQSPTPSTGTLGSLAEEKPLPPLSMSNENTRSSPASIRAPGSAGGQKPLPPLSTPNTPNERQRLSPGSTGLGSLVDRKPLPPSYKSHHRQRPSTASIETLGSAGSQKPLPLLNTTPGRHQANTGSIGTQGSLGDQKPLPPLFKSHHRQRPSTASIETLGSAGSQKPLPPLNATPGPHQSSTGSIGTPGSLGDQKPLPPLFTPTKSSQRLDDPGAAASAIKFSHTSLDLKLSPTFPHRPGRYPATVASSNAAKNHDDFRNSRESNGTDSSAHQPGSVQSSAATSASSISVINENAGCLPNDESPGGSAAQDPTPRNFSIPLFQYHHQQHEPPRRVGSVPGEATRSASNPELLENAGPARRHLTPTSGYWARGSLSRPQSSYSTFSDHGSRGRSPNLMPGGSHMRAPSSHSRNSPDSRLSTYAELLSVPYPQQAPALVSLDNSNLRNAVGNNASLLSTDKTLEMYRQNVKKTNDFSIQYSFAVFLISTAQEQGLDFPAPKPRKNSRQALGEMDNFEVESPVSNSYELVREARQILQRLANGGYPFAQYYLADGFASGLFSKGKEDYSAAFPLFVLAAKHGHAESAYRTALCYEFGWGCRKDPAKAVQFLRSAASKRHPGAMTRLGKACLSGDLGEKRYREGIKWMKLATEAADSQYNAAPYQLGCLYETGYGDDIFQDLGYAAELFTQAAELGHPEANYRMGDAYEHGRLNCPRDPALSVHFYTGAAERGHAGAMMGLCAWYMVGAAPILEKDEEEAYEWARRSAELGFVKAQYAAGYFTEMGIGCRRDMLEANVWYVKAADAGDERAKQRLAVIQSAASGEGNPMEVVSPRSGGKISKDGKAAKDDKECVIM